MLLCQLVCGKLPNPSSAMAAVGWQAIAFQQY